MFPLRIYILSLAAIGLLAFLYRTVFGSFLVKKWNYTVLEVKHLNETIQEISLKPLGPALSFKPGQFIFIQFPNSKLGGEAHPFSIVSTPEETVLRLAVKNLGDFTSKMDNLQVGDKAVIEGAFGHFTLDRMSSAEQVWVAGGIGITPFLSLAHSIPGAQKVDLFYCVGKEEEAVYKDELEGLALKNPGFRFHLYSSETQGRVSADVLEKELQSLKGKEVLMCAPPAMLHALRGQFIAKGILPNLIHSEEFNF